MARLRPRLFYRRGMQKEFYEKVLPAQGLLCCTTIDPNEPDERFKARNHFVQSVPELLDFIKKVDNTQYNIFVAVSSYGVQSRKADNALYTRSFFVDLDVGDSEKKYKSKEEAITALDSFVTQTNLPVPVRIDSGTGIHAYWIFDADIPSKDWVIYAEKFKKFCRDKGLKIDPTVTADIARIMRAVGTDNLKTTPPSRSFLINPDEVYQYSFEEFREFLGISQDVILDILAKAEKGLDEDTKSIILNISNFDSVFQVIAEKSLKNQGCGQIKYILENAKTLEEPLWHSGLSIARHCIDWETAIHTMSEDYPKYNATQTLTKANETLDKPHSCVVFNDRNPGICHKCPYWTKITNPLALGRVFKEDSPQNPVRQKPNTKTVPLFPKNLYPFVRGQNGGVYYIPPSKVDKDGNKIQDDPILLSEFDIYPIKRVFHTSEGASLLIRYILPHDPVREFIIPLRLSHAKDELIKLFAEQELSFSPASKVGLFMEYIVKWSQHLVHVDAAEQMRMQLGWTDDGDSFVIGQVELRRDGSILKSAASPLILSIAKLLRPEGSLQEWTNAINLLNAPSLEIHAFGVLCGFGSPLMRYTSTNGITVGFTGEAGSGKTGSLYSAISIFGNPKELSLSGGKDQATSNGLIGMYLALKNIMMGLDEAGNRNAQELSNLLFWIAHGKGKLRMRSDKNALREHEMSASMIALMTQNQSPVDKIEALKESPDGEMARYVEFQMNTPQALVNDPWLGKKIFETTKKHYGTAGPKFIQEIFRLGDTEVIKIINKWIGRFERDFGKRSVFRFYENLIGSTFAAGEIANNINLVSFDLERIYKRVLKSMNGEKEVIKINSTDYSALLGEFQNKYFNSILFMDAARVIREPKSQPLVGRAEIDNQVFWISTRDLRKFLSERQVNSRMFLQDLKEKDILLEESKVRLTSGWPGMSHIHPVQAYSFRFAFKDVEPDKNGPTK